MGRRRWHAGLEFSEGDSNNGHTVEERETRDHPLCYNCSGREAEDVFCGQGCWEWNRRAGQTRYQSRSVCPKGLICFYWKLTITEEAVSNHPLKNRRVCEFLRSSGKCSFFVHVLTPLSTPNSIRFYKDLDFQRWWAAHPMHLDCYW